MIVEIKYKIVEYGPAAEDLGFGAKGAVASKKAGRKVPVYCRDNNSNTWAGHGKCPGWLMRELSSGREVEGFLVT